MAPLRIGHTRLTKGRLLRNEMASVCEQYAIHLAVLHILWECSHYETERQTTVMTSCGNFHEMTSAVCLTLWLSIMI
jgi:hypothetical protein